MSESIAILGGTGKEGRGLGARWARAGRRVLIGSRDAARARTTAEELAGMSGGTVEGAANQEAAASAELAVVATPFAGAADTVAALRQELAGKLVVSAVIPLLVSDGVFGVEAIAEGSAAELIQSRLPESRVGAAFHNISYRLLLDLEHQLDEDVPIAADAEDDRQTIVDLAAELGARGVAVGPLSLARYLEGYTAVLLSVNKLHRRQAGIRFTGLP